MKTLIVWLQSWQFAFAHILKQFKVLIISPLFVFSWEVIAHLKELFLNNSCLSPIGEKQQTYPGTQWSAMFQKGIKTPWNAPFCSESI